VVGSGTATMPAASRHAWSMKAGKCASNTQDVFSHLKVLPYPATRRQSRSAMTRPAHAESQGRVGRARAKGAMRHRLTIDTWGSGEHERNRTRLRRRTSTASLAETLSPATTTNPKPALFRYTLVDFERPSRQSYLIGERWTEQLRVHEILAERLSVGEFPGYSEVRLPKATLDLIVRQGLSSWRGALSAVKGVYVITDSNTGKLYVGSAAGDGGIWARWSAYANTGHGGNKEVVALLRAKGKEYAKNFQFSILETADAKTGEMELVRRESHWKEVLQSRNHGYNAN
jgi:hypothetical protein